MDPAAVIDDLLEITVIGSFSRIGYACAGACSAGSTPQPGALAGRTVLLTGVTSGLGREAADELAALGARLILAGRDEAKVPARARRRSLRAHGEDRFPTVVVDMASLASVRDAVERILATEPRLDVVIDNAGAIFPTRQVTADGIEATLATMVVGPFALIAGLLPLLEATPGARVISVTSGGQYAQRLHLDDLEWTSEPWDGTRAYARAKRAQVSLIREWARRNRATRRRLRRDAPGLGGHARDRGRAAGLPPLDGPAPADAGAGRRHDGLAGRRPARDRPLGPARAGPSRAPVRPDPVDARLADGSPPALGRRRPPRRHRRPASRPRPGRRGMTRIHERLRTDLPIEARLRLHRGLRELPRLGSRHRVVAADRARRAARSGSARRTSSGCAWAAASRR